MKTESVGGWSFGCFSYDDTWFIVSGLLGHSLPRTLSDGRDSVKGVGESTLTASRHEFTAEIRITRQRLANIFLVKIHEMFLITFFGYVKVNVTRVTGSCVSYLESKT